MTGGCTDQLGDEDGRMAEHECRSNRILHYQALIRDSIQESQHVFNTNFKYAEGMIFYV